MPHIPRCSWFFLQPPSDIHGLGHTARVMVWAAVLTRGTEWFAPVVWAAACHDLRREDDGPDPDHGFRAGTWVREVLPGKLRQPPDGLDLVAQACDWHVCPDRRSRWDHPVLWLLKDADGLDRVRLGDLNPSYLRHQATHEWIDLAERLYQATAQTDDVLHIWQKASELGIPVDELVAFAQEQSSQVIEVEAPPPARRPARGW